MPQKKPTASTTDSAKMTTTNVVTTEEALVAEKKKRKKRSPDEEPYRTASRSAYSSESVKGFFGRASTEKFIKDETGTELKDSLGQPIPLKMSLLINSQSYKQFDLSELDQVIFDACSKHPVFRPVEAIVQANPTTGSPQKIRTPGKTLMHCAKKIGPIRYFSNDPLTKPIDQLQRVSSVDPAFFQSEAYLSVVPPSKLEKSSSVEITQKLLKETHKLKSKTSGRAKSQNAVMARPGVNASQSGAPTYTESAKVMIGIDTEYAHNIPYFVGGPSAQKEENLSITTAHANTDQLITYESMLKFLAKEYKNDKITLEVKSELIDKTQISHKLWVTLQTPHYTYSFEFDPQTINKPHLFQHESFKIFMKHTVRQGIENKMLSPEQLATIGDKPPEQKMRVFYTPSAPILTPTSNTTYETQISDVNEAKDVKHQPAPYDPDLSSPITQVSNTSEANTTLASDHEVEENETQAVKKPKP